MRFTALRLPSRCAPLAWLLLAPSFASAQECPPPESLTGPLQAQIDSLKAQNTDLTAAIRSKDETIANKESLIKSLQSDVVTKDGTITGLQGELSTKAAANKQLVVDLGRLTAERNNLAGDLQTKQQAADQVRQKLTQVTNTLTRAQREGNETDEKITKLQNEQARLSTELKAKQKEVEAANDTVKQANSELGKASSALAVKGQEVNEKDRLLGEERKKAQQAREEAAKSQSSHALFTFMVVIAVAALGTLYILYYLMFGRRSHQEQGNLFTECREAATSIRREKDPHGAPVPLLKAEERILKDLADSWGVIDLMSKHLPYLILATALGAALIAVFSIHFMNEAVNALDPEKRIELIKTGAWQALLGLFTPIATLIAGITLAHTRHKDLLTICTTCELVARGVSRPSTLALSSLNPSPNGAQLERR